MTRYLITAYNDPEHVRIIDAESFEVDGTGALQMLDGDGKLVARLINVNVEPMPTAKKQSSAKLSAIASKYLDFDLTAWLDRSQSPESAAKLQADIRSLAASVLSQDETSA